MRTPRPADAVLGLLLVAVLHVPLAAEVPLLRPQEREQVADRIVTGKVGKVTEALDDKGDKYIDKHFFMPIEVTAVEKGDGIRPGEKITAFAWQWHKRPKNFAGPSGQDWIPKKGQTVRLFFGGKRGDAFNLLYPNGVEEAKSVAKGDPSAKGASPDEDGFTNLFDGRTLDGWHVMNDGHFTAEEGVIKLDGGGGWLRSNREYADFVLKLEVRWMKPKQDSGIFLRAGKEGKKWPKQKYEVQCENSPRIAKLFGAKHERDEELALNTLKKDQEWNSYEIKCAGKRLGVKLNGTLVTTSEAIDRPSGYIGLQGEGGVLEFRNLRIKELPSEKISRSDNATAP